MLILQQVFFQSTSNYMRQLQKFYRGSGQNKVFLTQTKTQIISPNNHFENMLMPLLLAT